MRENNILDENIKKILNDESLTPIKRIRQSYQELSRFCKSDQVPYFKKNPYILDKCGAFLESNTSISKIKSVLENFGPTIKVRSEPAFKAFQSIVNYTNSLSEEEKKAIPQKSTPPNKKIEKISFSNETAILKTQSIFRGASVRKKYKIENLSDEKKTDYDAFFVGNDLVIDDLKHYQQKEPSRFALIGTSVLGSVRNALSLLAHQSYNDEKKANQNIPKLIIIDNSRKVEQLWRNLQKFATEHPDPKKFLENLADFLSKNSKLYRNCDGYTFSSLAEYHTQNIPAYFAELFKTYGSIVLKVISSATFICQRWEDEKTFEKLKNVLTYLGIEEIYVYPSNIASSASSENIDVILNNIFKLRPKLSIHTGSPSLNGCPQRFFLLTENNPQQAKAKLLPKITGIDPNSYRLNLP